MTLGFFITITSLLMLGSAQELLLQQERVEQAAAEVAAARSRGARNRQVSQLMAAYRTEAERLLQMETANQTEGAETPAAASLAQKNLREALASGQTAPEARKQLAEKADPIESKLKQLQAYSESAAEQPNPDWKKATYLDISDGLRLLILVANYDATQLQSQASALSTRAHSLEMRGTPGMGQNLGDAGESRRLKEQASALNAQSQAILSQRDQAKALLQEIYRTLETLQ